ncbi:MAG: hypothetical protein MMC33_003127 [Icmadophila ericetorum]|nr:hypothetical protein [Icmadophila ericetorum]
MTIATASQVIGFISFGITFLTLLRVTWGSIMTIFSAPGEAHDYLNNIRQELYELRSDLRRARKRQRATAEDYHSDGDLKKAAGGLGAGTRAVAIEFGSLRVLSDTVRHLQKQFRELERPFLVAPRDGQEDVDNAWLHYTMRVDYCDMDLAHRLSWLRRKDAIIGLAQTISRIQVRLINEEVKIMRETTLEMGRSFDEFDDRLWRVQARMRDQSRARSQSRLGDREEDERIYVRRRY